MPPARIGHRFQQLGQTMQSSFAQQALGLLFTESREDTLACDTIHERRLLERRVGLLSLSYLSWEASLSNNSQALPTRPILYALHAAYVILLKNRMEMGESLSPKPVTKNTLFYGDNLMERYGCY